MEWKLVELESENAELKDKLTMTQHNDLLTVTSEEKWRLRCHEIKKENEQMRDELEDKQRVLERLNQERAHNYIDRAAAVGHSRHARSRSESGLSSRMSGFSKQLQQAEGKLEHTEIRLQLKTGELEALKAAHQRRLMRLKNLLTSYKLVREQLKIAEEELGRPVKKRRLVKAVARPSSKQLQHEDNEAAWNELRHIKNENKNLLVIKMNLEEQLDDMAVQASEDASNLHELRCKCQALDDELKFMRRADRMTSTPVKAEQVISLKSRIASSEAIMEEQRVELIRLQKLNSVLAEEKRSMHFELNSLKKSLYEKKSVTNDLRTEITRLKRRLSQRKVAPTRVVKTFVTPIAQRYQKVLETSVHRLSNVLADSAAPEIPEQTETISPDQRPMTDELRSATLSELDTSVETQVTEETQATESLGEVIARKAEPEVQVLDSPTLMDHKGNRLETTAIELCGQIIKRTEQPQCAVRTVATSPMVFKNNARWHSRKSAFTQVSSLKQRLISLQLRVATLDKGKTEACLRADQLTAECETLQKQLTNANTALTTHRNTNQRLDGELRSCKERLAEQKAIAEKSIPTVQVEQERRILEQRIKALNQDLVSKSNSVKEVKQEAEELKEANTELNNRITRLERDVTQKRSLLDDLRLKLRLAKENTNSDLHALEVKCEEVARYKQISEQSKTQVESLKSSVKALTKGKKEYETKFKETAEDLSKKEKQLQQNQVKVRELQCELDELQRKAQEQLVCLADQGEAAVSMAHTQLLKSNSIIEQFQQFVQVLSEELLSRHESLRHQRQQQRKQVRKQSRAGAESSALTAAKKRAQEILNLSASDVENLLDSDDESDQEESFSAYWQKDRKMWIQKWEKALMKDNFVKRLSSLFLNKIDEVVSIGS